jgi:hypothetical protein
MRDFVPVRLVREGWSLVADDPPSFSTPPDFRIFEDAFGDEL